MYFTGQQGAEPEVRVVASGSSTSLSPSPRVRAWAECITSTCSTTRLSGLRFAVCCGHPRRGILLRGRVMPISPRAGLEGSGWRSAVTEKPQRS